MAASLWGWTMSKEKTKTILLEAGRQVFLERGYNNAGIEAVLQAAGVPKGSFYYYFDSKEDFGLQVLNRFAECHDANLDAHLGDETLSPLSRLRHHFEATITLLETKGCRNGCLAGNLSQEMADQSEAFRARLQEIFGRWVDRYADCIRQAQAIGEVAEDLDPHRTAEFLLHGWQGAILRAKIARNIAPLHTFLEMIFGVLFRLRSPAPV